MVRCAVYARFSTDMQRETSLDDQIAVAREYADRHGWTVLNPHIYTDAAVSGASLERPGIQGLLLSAAQRPAPFEVLLVDDSSRVARDLADAVRVMQQLRFLGIRVLYISQGIDSASEQAETLIAVHGITDALYLREMAKKIKRGLAGQLERGYATGGTTFGYRTIAVPDPSGKTEHGAPVFLGHRVEVHPGEAPVVAQIFQWYASGLGVGRIVARLNRERVRGPFGRPWRDGAIRRLLRNEKYRGFLIWGKKTFERRPGSDQYVQRPLPRGQWRMLERPELRIVDEDLWQRVQRRREAIAATIPPDLQRRRLMRGRQAVFFSPQVFSGFLTCGTCGGRLVLVTNGRGSPRYGCPQAWRNHLCTNRLTIRAKVADPALLEGMRRELLHPSMLRYISDALSDALQRRFDDRPRLLAETGTAREQTAARLQRLIDAIQQGVPASSVAGAIADRERELQLIEADLVRLAAPLPRLAVIPAWVEQQVRDLVGLLGEAPERVKVEFQRLGLRVTMHPILDAGPRPFYRAIGQAALPCLASSTDLASVRSGTDFAPETDGSTVGRSVPDPVRETFAGILEETGQGSTVGCSDPPTAP